MKLGDITWVAALVLSFSTSARAERADEIAARVQNFYDKTRSFEARFDQRYELKAYNKQKQSKGTVVFAKPGKMSFRYANNGNRVVSDTKAIRIYDADSRQLYEQAVQNSQYPAALSFLFGGGKLKRAFKLRKLDDPESSFKNGYRLVATPKEPTSAYRVLVLYVDAATYQVRRVLLIDAQGNRNRFEFSNVKVNQPIPASEFRFTPPAGTRIVR